MFLNTFPNLLYLGILAPVILRLICGVIFIKASSETLRTRKQETLVLMKRLGIKPETFWVSIKGLIELLGGILLIIGAFTQLTAIVLSLLTLLTVLLKVVGVREIGGSVTYYSLLLFVLISLIFTGAGIIAFDLPL